MMECVCAQLFITWCTYLLLFKGVETTYCASGTGSDVVQVCTSGTASGSMVHVDTRQVPSSAATCTCELDTGSGGIEYIDYNVNEGTHGLCGLYFGFLDVMFSCQSVSHQPQTTYTGFTYVQENDAAVPPCLSIKSSVETTYCASGTGSDVVQVCTSGTASGSMVHVDRRQVPSSAATCTCELDTGSGGIEYIDYNVNEGTHGLCGLYFGFLDVMFSCQSVSHQPQTTYTGFTYVQENDAAVPPCLSIKSKNTATKVTCLAFGESASSTTPSSNQNVTVTRSRQRTITSTTDSTTSSSTTTGAPSINNEKDTAGQATLGQPAIIGIAVGGGSIVIMLILVTICCVRRRKIKSKEPDFVLENDMYIYVGGSRTITDATHTETVSYINTHVNTTFDDTAISGVDKDTPTYERLDPGYDPILHSSSVMESSINR